MTFNEQRRLLGFTQESLAKKLEVNIRTVNNWERGKFRVSAEFCKKLVELGFSQESVIKPLGE